MVKLLDKKCLPALLHKALQAGKWAAAIILLLGAVLLIFLAYISIFWTCCAEPPDAALSRLRESCQSEGGYFIEELEICQLPASDAEKICEDSSECEGF